MTREHSSSRWGHVMIGVGIGLLLGGVGVPAAQPEPSGQVLLPAASLDRIYQQLNDIQGRTKHFDRYTTDILERLDVVIQNQEAMKQELDTIRIRASR